MPPPQVSEQVIAEKQDAAPAPFATTEAPSLRADAPDEQMPDAAGAAAREPEAVERHPDAPASLPEQNGTSGGAAPDPAEPRTQPSDTAEQSPSEAAATAMQTDPPPSVATGSAPGPAQETAPASAAAAPATADDCAVAAADVEAPAPSAEPLSTATEAIAMANGTAEGGAATTVQQPAANGAAPMEDDDDDDSEDDIPLAKRVVTPAKPPKPGAAPSQTGHLLQAPNHMLTSTHASALYTPFVYYPPSSQRAAALAVSRHFPCHSTVNTWCLHVGKCWTLLLSSVHVRTWASHHSGQGAPLNSTLPLRTRHRCTTAAPLHIAAPLSTRHRCTSRTMFATIMVSIAEVRHQACLMCAQRRPAVRSGSGRSRTARRSQPR